MTGRLTATVLLLASATVAQLHSQLQPSHGAQIWFRGGYDPPTGAILGLAGQHRIFIVEGRITGKEVISDEVAGFDAGILVGVATPAFRHPYVHLSLSVGIAYTWFTDGSECMRCPEDPGAALALGLHVSVRPISFLGVGFFAYANRNGAEPFGGSGVMIEIGKLR